MPCHRTLATTHHRVPLSGQDYPVAIDASRFDVQLQLCLLFRDLLSLTLFATAATLSAEPILARRIYTHWSLSLTFLPSPSHVGHGRLAFPTIPGASYDLRISRDHQSNGPLEHTIVCAMTNPFPAHFPQSRLTAPFFAPDLQKEIYGLSIFHHKQRRHAYSPLTLSAGPIPLHRQRDILPHERFLQCQIVLDFRITRLPRRSSSTSASAAHIERESAAKAKHLLKDVVRVHTATSSAES